MKIEKMLLSHLDDVAELEKQCFSQPWGKALLKQELLGPYSVMIVGIDEKTNEIIAFAGVRIVYYLGDITSIAVKKEYRGLKYGNMLMSWLINYCKNELVEKINLEVRTSNLVAIKMYQSLGFKVTDKLENYYNTPQEDAFLMVKYI